MADLDDARRTLGEVFGFRGFRKGQKRIISRLLNNVSTLAILPTSGGKSLCYQLPALLLDGLTVVISPLIALMKDQVDFLTALGISAARLDSSLDASQSRQVCNELGAGRLKLLFVAPERLANERFLHMLSGQKIALLAVDEAHCISEWGHNFRPEYLKLARLAEQLDVGCVLALTATATPQVASEVAAAFGVAENDIVATSFHRPNLELNATPCRKEERHDLLLGRLRERPTGPTIIYVTLQHTAEKLADLLAGKGFNAVAYHAGLPDAKRHRVQDAFMASTDMIVVATIAFGMGIDKADIRYVYHYNMPQSPEGYAQETGRAGRDGQPAVCELFACPADLVRLENFHYGDTPTPEAIAGLLADVMTRGAEFDLSITELSNRYDIRQPVLRTLLTYLELDGFLEATGASYAEYKFQLLRPIATVLQNVGARRADLAERIIHLARHGAIWYTLDVDKAVKKLKVSRDKIVSILTDMELHGHATLTVHRVSQGFRRLPSHVDLDRLCKTLAVRFKRREERDLARIRQVLEFAEQRDCLTRVLLSYFGEELAEECGHCDRCLGAEPTSVPLSSERKLGAKEQAMLVGLRSEGHTALAAPRQIARFLCGLTSPATSYVGLTKDRRFGILADVPFARVLGFLEGRCLQALSATSKFGL